MVLSLFALGKNQGFIIRLSRILYIVNKYGIVNDLINNKIPFAWHHISVFSASQIWPI